MQYWLRTGNRPDGPPDCGAAWGALLAIGGDIGSDLFFLILIATENDGG